jgi:hypothetical protein
VASTIVSRTGMCARTWLVTRARQVVAPNTAKAPSPCATYGDPGIMASSWTDQHRDEKRQLPVQRLGEGEARGRAETHPERLAVTGSRARLVRRRRVRL